MLAYQKFISIKGGDFLGCLGRPEMACLARAIELTFSDLKAGKQCLLTHSQGRLPICLQHKIWQRVAG